MVERVSTEKDLIDYIGERTQTQRLRSAISFCKNALEMTHTSDRNLKAEDRMNVEKCLTENYLIKHGMDYFGKRDLIYIDLYGSDDIRAMNTAV